MDHNPFAALGGYDADQNVERQEQAASLGAPLDSAAPLDKERLRLFGRLGTAAVLLYVGCLWFEDRVFLVPEQPSTAATILGVLANIGSVASLLFLHFSDPGTLDPNSVSSETDLEMSTLCPVCQSVRPEGVFIHHCRVCDVCVTDFDHHCFVLGMCIGRRNTRWFALLLFSGGLGNVACLVHCSQILASPAHTPWGVYVLLLINLAFMCQFFLMATYYVLILSAGTSQHEMDKWSESHNNHTPFIPILLDPLAADPFGSVSRLCLGIAGQRRLPPPKRSM